ncbi:MAG: DUF2892 domain-containing protein [Planctomycetaceae bacterium]|nr:DUF2892 domain-containing protein [Planctomycetaceae bacterium]
MSTTRSISPKQLKELHDEKAVDLIDVRTPMEFQEVHATIARNIPLDTLKPSEFMEARNGSVTDTLYVICKSGSRGAKACQKFQAAGYEDVVNVEGGTESWIASGLPVERGKKVMSLERQVRIVAGAIILFGAILALTVHPYFAGLSAFVGAGLMFAGITDTCGMAMVLAKMPWNQSSESSCST